MKGYKARAPRAFWLSTELAENPSRFTVPYVRCKRLGESLLDLNVELRRLLTELAYLACMSNDVGRARRIIGGLSAVTPNSPEAVIGYALADMTARDFDASIRRLRPLVDSGDLHAIVFYGLALKLAGRGSEAQAVLDRLPAGDPAVEALAGALR